jgi:hypothetical protein
MYRLQLAFALCVAMALPARADPLPSWNDTEAKAAIIEFVEGVIDPASGCACHEGL